MREPTREQWHELWELMRPSLQLFNRLRTRLERIGMPVDCRYYREVTSAFDAIHTVSVSTHYASCNGGVGDANRIDADEHADRWLGDGI